MSRSPCLQRPVSTSTQYACADDLVLSVITDSESGAGGRAGTYRPIASIAIGSPA